MARESAQSGLDRDATRGLFDVLARRSGRTLLALYVIWTLLAGLLTYARFVTAENPPLAWTEIVIIGIVSAAVTVGIAVPLGFGIMEGIPMVLAELRKRFYRDQGREAGRKERDRLWEAWLERREEAEREGLPFDEPPPSLHGTRTDNGH